MTELNATALTHQTICNGKAYTLSKRNVAYVKESKTAKALLQVSNWLKAAGIEPRKSSVEGCDLAIKRLGDTGVIDIKIALGPDDNRPAAEHLFVLATELTHRSKPIALAAFHSLTQAAGYGKPEAINRGVEPLKKLSFEDNFELVAMRHKEFRKVPNPTAAELDAYKKVIDKAVSRFLYINTKICKRHGIDRPDLVTYAQIWTCNYLGLYKVANPTNNDNERKLYAHLCQRFGNFVEVLLKKERSCIPDSETASVAIFGVPYAGFRGTGTGRRVWQQEYEADAEEALELEAEDAGTVDGENELVFDPETQLVDEELMTVEVEERETRADETRRRREAQATLKAKFATLDHSTLTFLLQEAATNGALCPDARAEAKKQLRLHREACQGSCKPQEDAAGAQSIG